jgi:predicted dithiol-disulfide oxidoreductase (DUF899 family)
METIMARVVSSDEWIEARKTLLEEEKALQKARDELAKKRRELPWRRVEPDYSFEGENGTASLPELFGDCSQLIIYHFMYHPDWEEGCKSCSFWADQYDAVIPHLKARDVALACVSRGPLAKLLAYRDRMGWSFPWYSSAGNSFNHDFNVSFTPEQVGARDGVYNYRQASWLAEELPGLSTFVRDADGAVYHSYSTFSRGLDPLNATYQMLDLVAKGRDEDELEFPMAWVRRNDEY